MIGSTVFINSPELVDDLEKSTPPRLRNKADEFFHPLPEACLQISIPFRIIGKIDQPWPAFQKMQREAAPIAAVLAVIPIIPHHETMARRNGQRGVIIPNCYVIMVVAVLGKHA